MLTTIRFPIMPVLFLRDHAVPPSLHLQDHGHSRYRDYHATPPSFHALPRDSHSQNSSINSHNERHRQRSAYSEGRDTPKIFDTMQTRSNTGWEAASPTLQTSTQQSMRTGDDAAYGRSETVSSRDSSASRPSQSYTVTLPPSDGTHESVFEKASLAIDHNAEGLNHHPASRT